MKKTLSAQELYLKSVRRTNCQVRLWRVLICVLFLSAWELCARQEIICIGAIHT